MPEDRHLDLRLQKYYYDYEEGDISAKVLNKAIERLEDEKDLQQKLLNELEIELNKNINIQKELGNFKVQLENWKKEYKLLNSKDVVKKKMLLIQIIKHIEIISSKDKNIEDRINIVFKVAESMWKTGISPQVKLLKYICKLNL